MIDNYIITRIDSYRDGGTKVIETTKESFFIHKHSNTLHSGYPTTLWNQVHDKEVIDHFNHRLNRYRDSLLNKIGWCDAILGIPRSQP